MGEGIEGGECQLLESASSREWLNALELCGVAMPFLGSSECPLSTGKTWGARDAAVRGPVATEIPSTKVPTSRTWGQRQGSFALCP